MALQLILEVIAELAKGQFKIVHILIKMGAEPNLIKTEIIPYHLTYPAKKLFKKFHQMDSQSGMVVAVQK
jgi:hypothetical protein